MSALSGFTGPTDSALAGQMAATLAHRGEEVQSLSNELGTLLVQKGTPGDGATAEQGRVLIALAGTCSEDLHSFAQKYQHRGIDAAIGLRGAFVLAVLDNDVLHLVRDGAGARTVYYGWHRRRFIFSSEPKGVLCAEGFPRDIRGASVALYLSMSFIPGSHTMLQELFELPPGCILTVRPGQRATPTRYFRFEEHEPAKDPAIDDWPRRFRAVFGTCVRERVPANGKFAAFLSGGIDSSAVVAELASQGHKFPTYAIHFGERYDNELSFAAAVARRCGTKHHEVEITPAQFLPRFRQAVWHMDEPIGDPITIPNFELARQVAGTTTSIFNGEGGDPCFGGPKNLTMMLHHWYGGVERGPRYRERRYLESYRRAYTELGRLLNPDVARSFDHDTELEGVLTPFFEADLPSKFLHKLLAINIRLKGAHLILPKVERMLGAWGCTPLSPLFDERIIQLAFEMPATMKVRAGKEKVVIKEAYRDLLPPEVVHRPKSGMRVPVHWWFKDELHDYARDILDPTKIDRVGIFNGERVRQLLDYEIDEGPGRYGLRLWMLLSFETWRRLVIEGEAV